jgi:hypothetical protein
VILTLKEQKRVREGLRYLRWRYGGWRGLAKLLHVSYANLRNMGCKDSIGPTLAFRIAHLAEVSIDDVLSGKMMPANTCPHCGRNTRNFDHDETIIEPAPTDG